MKKLSLTIQISIFLVFISIAQVSHADDYYTDTISYTLKKFETNDIVLLGTSHKQPPILNFISNLIPELHHADVSHICLEIPSDQQEKINSYLVTGDGLSDIQIWSTIDCPEYRLILDNIRKLPPDKKITPIAIDLPESRFKEDISRDEYMAQRISGLLKDDSCKKMMVVMGNLHMLKKLDWEDHIKSGHKAIREYLSISNPEIKMFSIAQVIDEDPEECDFTKEFSDLPDAVALDCSAKHRDWKLGVLAPIAIKKTEPYDAFDGLIVY